MCPARVSGQFDCQVGAILYGMSPHRSGRVIRAAGLLAAITALIMFGGVVGLFVLGNHGGNPSSQVRADDPLVRRARFTRAFGLDGALRVDPPTGSPRVPESRAIAAFRTTFQPWSYVYDVVIGFGMVTLRADLTPEGQPVLTGQPSWVVTFYGRLPCLGQPSMPVHPVPGRRPVFILDATTGTHGINYLSYGSYCNGLPTGPQAQTAAVIQSVPWTVVSTASDGRSVTVRYLLPPCGTLYYSQGPSPLSIQVTVPLNDLHCPATAPKTLQLPVQPGQPVLHGYVGVCTTAGLFPCTAATKFEYFDGRVRSAI